LFCRGILRRSGVVIHTPDGTKFSYETKDQRGRASIYEISGLTIKAAMIFSRTSQYAIQALIYLATQPSGRRVLNREIAQNLGVPLAYLAKILQDLSREKLLHCPADGRRPRRSRVSARAQGLPGRDCLSPASQVETHQEENPRQPWKRNPDPSCAGCSKRPIPVDRSAAGAVAALKVFHSCFFPSHVSLSLQRFRRLSRLQQAATGFLQ
jgi:hypothetical protein